MKENWDWYQRVQRRRALAEGFAFVFIPIVMLAGIVSIIWAAVQVIRAWAGHP